MNSPAADPPQCATVSSSPYPSLVSFQLEVLMGMFFLSSVPGLVVEKTFLCLNVLNFTSLLSIVADLMSNNFSLTETGAISSLNFSRTAIYSGSIGASLCPQG